MNEISKEKLFTQLQHFYNEIKILNEVLLFKNNKKETVNFVDADILSFVLNLEELIKQEIILEKDEIIKKIKINLFIIKTNFIINNDKNFLKNTAGISFFLKDLKNSFEAVNIQKNFILQ